MGEPLRNHQEASQVEQEEKRFLERAKELCHSRHMGRLYVFMRGGGNSNRALPLRRQSSSSHQRQQTKKRNSFTTKGLFLFCSTSTAKKHSPLSFSSSSSSLTSTTASGNAPTSSNLANIFDSGIVSHDVIITELEKVMNNEDVVGLELEDFLVGHMIMKRSMEIPQKIAHILRTRMRPWEGITFVDEVLLNSQKASLLSQYHEYKRSRKQFLRGMHGICAQLMIKSTVKTKINVTIDDDSLKEGEQQQPTDGSQPLEDLIQLLREFERDKSVVCLNITSTKTSPKLVQSLTNLLLCDHRLWEEIHLDLRGVPDGCKAIRYLKSVAVARDIELDRIVS